MKEMKEAEYAPHLTLYRLRLYHININTSEKRRRNKYHVCIMQAKSYMMMVLMVLVPPLRRHSQRCTFRSMHCCTGKMCMKCVCVFARTCILSHRNTTQHDTAEKQNTVNAKQLEAYLSTPHFFCNNLFIMHRADKMKWQRTL